jgi:lipopolysaccharide transport system ATP-binding protein
MEEIGRAGRTVLFVSHNLSAIRDLCHRALLFNGGELQADGSPAEAISRYSDPWLAVNRSYVASKNPARPHLKRAEASQAGSNNGDSFAINQPITLSFEIETANNANVSVAVLIRNERDLCIYHSSDEFSAQPLNRNAATRQCVLPPYALASGSYSVDVHIHQRHVEIFEVVPGALQFAVHFEGTLASMTKGSDWKGTCGPGLLSWS